MGLSFTGTFAEAIELSNLKATKTVGRLLKEKGSHTGTVIFYIYTIPAETVLPQGVHLSRDRPFNTADDVPQGHHTINALHRFETGEAWVEGPIRGLNGMGVYIASIRYAVSSDGLHVGEALLRRTSIKTTDSGKQFEGIIDSCKPFLAVVWV